MYRVKENLDLTSGEGSERDNGWVEGYRGWGRVWSLREGAHHLIRNLRAQSRL